jgi:hypothetical protein
MPLSPMLICGAHAQLPGDGRIPDFLFDLCFRDQGINMSLDHGSVDELPAGDAAIEIIGIGVGNSLFVHVDVLFKGPEEFIGGHTIQIAYFFPVIIGL